MTPGSQSLSLTIEIPTANPIHHWTYLGYKNILKLWIKLTYTTHTVSRDGKVTAKSGLEFSGRGWLIPDQGVTNIAENKKKQDLLDQANASPEEKIELKKKASQDRLKAYENQNKPKGEGFIDIYTDGSLVKIDAVDAEGKSAIPDEKKDPYIELPWQIQIACGYFGRREHIAVGHLISFSSSSEPGRSVETFTFSIIEYNFRQTSEEEINENDSKYKMQGKKKSMIEKTESKIDTNAEVDTRAYNLPPPTTPPPETPIPK